MKKFKLNIALHCLLLFAAATTATWLYLKHYTIAAIFVSLFFTYLLLLLYALFADIVRDYKNFVEAIQYRDFSQRFAIQKAPKHLRFFRSGFNDIISSFKTLSKEKEAQYQYLQNVLEVVNTGIMAFETGSEKIIWVNQLMKDYLQLPTLQNLQRIKKYSPNLYAELQNIAAEEQKIINLSRLGTHAKMLLTANTFISEEKTFKLIILQNVDKTIDITESEAWEKLLRVLTHEIMNSIAPIASVANTLQQRLKFISVSKNASTDDILDLQDGIETIKLRSNGLLRFSESYRSLNKIGQAHFSTFYVRDLFESLLTLMQPSLQQKGIELDIILKNTNLQLLADRELVEQLLLNLVLNAMDAVKESPLKQITLTGDINEFNKPVIKISDTGEGMDAAMLERIFIPFFSTKKVGSGIGLSLCKQIMLLHKGSIQIQSKIAEGSVFSLNF